MIDSICIFEGIRHQQLFPLVHIRPTFDLRCGITNLREKITRNYPNVKISLHCRNYLADHIKARNPNLIVNDLNTNGCLFINGRIVADDKLSKMVPLEGSDTLYVDGDTIVAARISGQKLQDIKNQMDDVLTEDMFSGLIKKEVNTRIIHYPWDLVHYNSEELVNDFNFLMRSETERIKITIPDGVHIVEKDNIFIDEGVSLKPGAVLDASDGPIYLAKNAQIFPNAGLLGPVYIGQKSQIKMGAKIYHDVSIGNVCKVGGEVEGSIIHSYSNKQHDGFLGHSYLGAWVNLGADTNNSDLKNNYGSVKVFINGEAVDSGSQFVGLTMGDHSKTAINTMFNTGTVVGICCNIFGPGFPQKYIPSYSWGGADAITTYDFEKCIEVAKRVMERRDISLSDAAKTLMKKVFNLTQDERRERGLPY